MKNVKQLIIACTLIILGILFRTVWHLGPNVEFVTTASLLAGAYLSRKWSIFVPLAIMVISDLSIGNTNIFIFTWSAYVLIGIVGYYIQKAKIQSSKYKVIKATAFGMIASLWFYLWTNFGVWLLDSWGMYPKTLTGLIDAYILALPFLKLNFLGNLIFVPVSFTIVEVCKAFNLGIFLLTDRSKRIRSL